MPQLKSPHVREFKAVLDSGFHTLDSGFQVLGSSLFQWNLDSGFQSLVGIRIPWNVFWIPKPRIPNSTSQIFPVFRIQQSKISQIRESWLPYSRPLSAFFILFKISFKTVVLFVLLMTGYILAGWNIVVSSLILRNIFGLSFCPWKIYFRRILLTNCSNWLEEDDAWYVVLLLMVWVI